MWKSLTKVSPLDQLHDHSNALPLTTTLLSVLSLGRTPSKRKFFSVDLFFPVFITPPLKSDNGKRLIHSKKAVLNLYQVSDELKKPSVKTMLMDQWQHSLALLIWTNKVFKCLNLILSFIRASDEGLIVQQLSDTSSYLPCSVAIDDIIFINETGI